MKIAAINALPTGSPATIMRGILEVAQEELGAECKSFYGNWKACPKEYKNSVRFGFRLENYASAILSQRTGFHGIGSVFGTLQLIRELENFKPDILHLHNLHLWCINLPLLFRYIKKRNIQVVWTLHDCWAFTGRCPYFQITKCNRWKKGCHNCPYPAKEYPASYTDQTKKMWQKKKRWFTNVPNMTLVTPSKWLASLVAQSYFGEYQIKVINNGIDLALFKPTKSELRNKYSIEGKKYLILGVAFEWGKRKGLDIFLELAKRLENDYQIVMVGVNSSTKEVLPKSIISINRTNNQEELAKIYSAADVFVNPTREDNYPTVNMESISCGTPVITFDTGGSPEMISDETGIVVPCEDIDELERAIRRTCETESFRREDISIRAREFDCGLRYHEYIELYKGIYS